MADKSLYEFANDIKNLIDDGRSSEAVPLAQYLLRIYPRYLTGYRLLAEAALELGYTRDAIEVFRRVLSADPESFVAYAGLAAAYAEEDAMDEALWHMMRAFEIKPDMREIRQQLRYYYEMRDGRAPGRLHLNRPALARMYMRDGWFERAAEELCEELRREPHRMDLLATLAEAQWRAGRRHEAVQSAEKILYELPYCLKSNLILGQFYAQEEEMQKAQRYLRVAHQMDPENEMAVRLFGDASFLEFHPVEIRADEEDLLRTGVISGLQDEPLPEWLSDLALFNNLNLDEEYVDWDAIVAYETDWRTLLATATREAIGAFKPDWRIELRRATYLDLQTRGELPAPSPAPRRAPSESIPAPEAEAPRRRDAAPRPAWEGELRESTPSDGPRGMEDWRPALAEETRATLEAYVAPREEEALPAAAAEWQDRLYQVTRAAVERYRPEEGETSLEPIWLPALYEATCAALTQWRPARQEESAEVEEREVLPAWVEALYRASQAELAMWVARPARSEAQSLRQEQHRTGTLGRERYRTGTLGGARWKIQLRTETALQLASVRVTESKQRDEQWKAPSSTPPTEEELALTEQRNGTGKSHPAGWAQKLHDETMHALQKAAGRPAEQGGVSPDRAADVVDGGQDRPGHSLSDEAGTFWNGESGDSGEDWLAREADAFWDGVASDLMAEEGSEPPPVTEESEPAPRDEVGAARQAWEGGKQKEALAIYQRLLYESPEVDEALLADELSAWTATGEAPGLAYQFLGDLYRRMGRMQEAVALYREAINRM